ncbi:MAG: 50S ribosomal protein L22 [Spirochaetaceae bacterium]|jgi:large subunit ribosomal protein L22|nr:50S ribosomal protein L22 [Spirochaetaceae bacterium]
MAETKTKPGYRAVAKYMLASPYKMRPVADLIRRKPYPEAMSLLENMPHRSARIIRKTLKSAASNALSKNKQLDEDMLYVKEILVDEGPRMKRIWFRARGRADMLLKRMCHVTVVIDEVRASGAPQANSSSRKAGE